MKERRRKDAVIGIVMTTPLRPPYAMPAVLRSEPMRKPIRLKALSIYRLRGQVEQDFNQFKNWVDGNRLRCTDTAYWGKLLVCTLATSLRMMAIKGAHDREQGNRKIPNNSGTPG